MALIAAALAALPVPTASATTFLGSTLGTIPDESNYCGPDSSDPFGCTYVQTLLPGRTLAVTAPGVITTWSVRTGGCGPGGGDDQNMRLRVVRTPLITPGTYSGGGTSAPEFVTNQTGSIHTFTTRLPVRFGDRIGLDPSSSPKYGCVLVSHAGAMVQRFYPALVDGGAFVAPDPSPPNWELALRAGVEADTDGDGFGDETQDKCLALGGPDGGCPAAAPDGGGGGGTTGGSAPALQRVRMSRARFRVGRAQTPKLAARRRTATGTAFLFTLSAPARVTIRIERAVAGRLVRRRGKRVCSRPTRRNRKARRCTRYLSAGTLTRSLGAGPARVSFSGRIARKALRPGVYRATLRATAAAGNSKVKRLRFRVVSR